MVAPSVCVSSFVLDTVSFDSPFSWTFPLHDTAALVGSEDNDELASAAKVRITAVPARDICSRG